MIRREELEGSVLDAGDRESKTMPYLVTGRWKDLGL